MLPAKFKHRIKEAEVVGYMDTSVANTTRNAMQETSGKC